MEGVWFRKKRRLLQCANSGDTHNDLRSAASLLSGDGPCSMTGSESDPDRIRYGHSDGYSIVYYEFLYKERSLPVEDLEKLRHFLFQDEAVAAARFVWPILPAEQEKPQHGGRRIEDGLAILDLKALDASIVDLLHQFD